MQSLTKIEHIKGTDNVSDPGNLQPRGGTIYLRELINLDIDDEGKPRRRKGYSTPPIIQGPIHSLWSNKRIILFVRGDTLMKLNRDLTGATPLVVGLDPNDRMAYVGVGDNIVFFANSSIVGHIIGEYAYPFPEPQQQFKRKMVGGQLLEFYNNRLYAANGNLLFYSDATILTRMDTRKNVLAFPGRITMLKAVQNGIYLSYQAEDIAQTVFLSGLQPDEFVNRPLLDEAAFEGSAVSVEGDTIGRSGIGKTVYFATPSGIYKGHQDGIVTLCQEGLFAIEDDVGKVSAAIREEDGCRQYVMLYELKPPKGGIEGEFVATVPQRG